MKFWLLFIFDHPCGNGKPKLSSDDGSYLVGIVRASIQGCQKAQPQIKQT